MSQKKKTEWDIFHAALQGGVRRILLWGPPGVGKSRSAALALAACRLQEYQWSCCEDQLVQEALGHWVVRGQQFVWHDGPWARALRHGALILNELPRASVSVRDAALSVLDDADTCRIALPTGENLTPHPDFRCIATANDAPQDTLCDALVDRFDLILHVVQPHPALVARLNKGEANLGNVIARTYGSEGTEPISPRRGLAFLALAKLFDRDTALALAFRERADDLRAVLAVETGHV